MSEENEKIENNSRVDETRKRINRKQLAKTCKFFAVFAVAIMVISSFAVMVKAETYSVTIDVSTLPWEHDFVDSDVVDSNKIKIQLTNVSEEINLLVDVSQTSENLNIYLDRFDGNGYENIGTINSGISNVFIITINAISVLKIEPVTSATGHIIIDKIEKSSISSPDDAKITGKTFYKINSQCYVADVGLPQTESHNITINPDENIIYMGITQGSISRYNTINGGETEIITLPKNSYIRLLSEHPVNFNLTVEIATGEISAESFVTGITAYSQNDSAVFDRLMLYNIEQEKTEYGWNNDSSMWKTSDNARWDNTTGWWCGNTSTGQYNPNMNDVLLSPSVPLNVSSNPTLSFWTKYHLEGTSISYWGFPRLDLPVHDRYALFTDSEQKFILNVSSTQVYTYEPITFCISSDEEILNVTWFFGDSHMGYGCSVNHSYSDNGVYTVDVIVTNNTGEITTFQATITVLNRPPVPVIDVYQIVNVTLRVAGKKNNTVSMILMENDTVVGETSVIRQSGNPDEQNKTISLKVRGDKNYTVHLDYNGSNGGANPVKIIAESKEMYNETNILFNSENETYQNKTMNIDDVLEDVLKDNTEAIFNASASYDTDGYINNFVWAFGDGTSGAGMVVNYTYAVHGAYDITLNITDDDNASSNATAVVHLSEPVLSNTEYSYMNYNWNIPIINPDIKGSRLDWGIIINPKPIIINRDNIYVEISPDNNTWNTLSVYPYTGTKNSSNLYGNVDGWVKKEISLSNYIGQNVYVRFRMVSDGSVEYSAPCIDDVQIGTFVDKSCNKVVLTHENTNVSGGNVFHTVRVENKGGTTNTFILEATYGALNRTSVTLSLGESALVSVQTSIPSFIEGNPYDVDNDGINNAEEFYLPYYYGKIYTKDYFDSRNITRDSSNLPVPLDVTDISNYTVLYGNNSQIKLKMNVLEDGAYNVNIVGIATVNDTQEGRLSNPIDIGLENQTGKIMITNYANTHSWRGHNDTCNVIYWWNNYTFRVYLGKGTHNVTIGLNSSTYNESSPLILLLNHLYIEKYGINPLSSDSDMDGINDVDEYLDGLSPCSADSDNDYIMDNVEIGYWQSNGLLLPESVKRTNNPDFDNDRLVDGFEILYNTNITNPDSDNDGLNDYDEIFEYTKAERIEAEDASIYNNVNVIDIGEGIQLKSDDNSSFNMDFVLSEKGSYRVKVVGSSVVNTSVTKETNKTYNQTSTGTPLDIWASDPVVAGEEREIMSGNVAEGTTNISLSSSTPVYKYSTGSMELKTKIMDNFVEITDRRYYTIYGDLEKGGHTFHYELSNSSDDSLTVTIDYFLIERNGLDPWNNDTDSDGLTDGEEVINYTTSPWTNDTDNDGLTDFFEVKYGTNPNEKDTDKDGIDDYEEIFDDTNPVNPDTDYDGLWDGYNITVNGVFHTGELSYNTNATKSDTDDDALPDAWEIKYGLDPNNGVGINGGSGHADTDTLNNTQEYNLGTDPKNADTDNDGLDDREEIISILFRTNISYGAVRINSYQNENLTDKWIYYNGSEWVTGNEYRYSGNFTNPTNISSASPINSWNKLILTLKDNTKLYLNTTNNNDTIYVWEPNADIDDADSNGVIEGKCYQFTEAIPVTVESSNLPVAGYKNKEIFYGANPLKNDTDYDGVFDGDEYDWANDYDNDGIINVLDRDSDNDGLFDGQEALDEIVSSYSWLSGKNDQDSDGIPNMVDPDSDDDGISDALELLPLSDIDNDTLPNFIDEDSDGDGLLDGVEDVNHNGTIEENETSPIRADTDNDGLSDYDEIFIHNTTPTRADTDFDSLNDGDEIGLVETDNIPNTYLTNPINPDTDNDTLLDGQEIKGWYIMVEQGDEEHLTLVTSNPLMADSDNDGLLDSEEIYNAVYWVSEAENYRINDTQLVDNNMAITNKPGTNEIYNITLSIPNGTYQYYVRAKTGNETILNLVVNCSGLFTDKTVTLTNEYRWYSTPVFNLTNRTITMFASGGVFVDKTMLVKLNATVINMFSDGSSDKTINYYSSGGHVSYISIPYGTYINEALISISGVNTDPNEFMENITEELGMDLPLNPYTMNTTFDDGVSNNTVLPTNHTWTESNEDFEKGNATNITNNYGSGPLELEYPHTSGIFISQIFDAGSAVIWREIHCFVYVDEYHNDSVQVYFRTSQDSVTWCDWFLVISVNETFFGELGNEMFIGGRYAQYKVILNRDTSTGSTPALYDIAINYTYGISLPTFPKWVETTTADFNSYVEKTNIDTGSDELKLAIEIDGFVNDYYYTNGTYTSEVFDAGSNVALDRVIWNVNIPLGTSLTIRVRASYDQVSWQEEYISLDCLSIISSESLGLVGQYIQYIVEFNSNTLRTKTPVMYDITLTYTMYNSTGDFTSKVFDAGSNVFWDNISWVEDVPNGTSVIIKTKTSWDSSSWSSWSDVDGNNITSPDGKFIMFKVVLFSTNSSVTPMLCGLRINYRKYDDGYTYISGVIDKKMSSVWENICWVEDAPANTGVTVNTSVSEDGYTWTPWSICTNNAEIPSPDYRYLKYMVLLTTTNTTITPILESITLRYRNYVSNISIDIGDDGSVEYYYPGMFNIVTETLDLSSGFNQYLPNAETENSFVVVPINISSDSPGKLTVSNINIHTESFASNPFSNDTDYDGLWDGDEIQWFEKDGIENLYPSDPADSDTDDDLLSDGKEVVGWNITVDRINDNITVFVTSDPRTNDTDSDDIPDFIEYNHLNASNSDTDEDGLTDDLEMRYNESGAYWYFYTYPADIDTDNDGLPDGWIDGWFNGTIVSGYVDDVRTPFEGEDLDCDGVWEPGSWSWGNQTGGDYGNETDPRDGDTDNDWVPDGTELMYMVNQYPIWYGVDGDQVAWLDVWGDPDNDGIPNTLDIDSDNDGLPDGMENWDHDAWLNGTLGFSDDNPYYAYASETNPYDPDSDDDLIWDGNDLWNDTDPSDTYAQDPNDWVLQWNFDFDNDSLINAMDQDSDDDNSNDGVEDSNQNGYYEPELGESNPLDTDSDDDGLTDGEDPNPTDADSDDDGINDGEEVGMVLNPLDPDTDKDGIPDGTEIGVISSISDTLYYSGTDETATFINWFGVTILRFIVDEDTTTITNPLKWDSDMDGFGDGEEDYDSSNPTAITNFNGKFDNFYQETDPTNPDTDNDGIIDGDDPCPYDADFDNDGISDGEELKRGLNLSNSDSDDDGLSDGTEIGLTSGVLGGYGYLGTDTSATHTFTYTGLHPCFVSDNNPNTRTDPDNDDSDGDGIVDGLEDKDFDGLFELNGGANGRETDPNSVDSDNDGIRDGDEDKNHDGMIGGDTDNDRILDTGEVWSESDPTRIDTDGDGLLDNQEDKNKNGLWEINKGETCAYNCDSDSDKLLDGYNITAYGDLYDTLIADGIVHTSHVFAGELTYGTDPLKEDTDNDGLWDGYTVGTNIGEFSVGTNPLSSDTDMDGLSDYIEVVAGITFYQDYYNLNGQHITSSVIVDATQFSPFNPDTDGDGLSDGQEVNGWTVMIAKEVDGEMKTEEYTFKTDPTQNQSYLLDSDRDGICDADEMYPGINYGWYVNEVKEKAQESYDSTSGNYSVKMQAYNDTYYREINVQFNPYIKENRPPMVDKDSVYISSELESHWEWGWVGIVYCYYWVLDHCWTKVTVTVQDVSGISSIKVGVTDRNRWKTLYMEDAESLGDNKYKFSTCIDIDYWADYLLDYHVKVIIKDEGDNSISFEQKINGVFGGVIEFLADVWEGICGAVTAAIDAVMEVLNAFVEWARGLIEDAINSLISPVKSAINSFVSEFNQIISKITDGSATLDEIIYDLVGLLIGHSPAHQLMTYLMALAYGILALEIGLLVVTTVLGGGLVLNMVSEVLFMQLMKQMITGSIAVAGGLAIVTLLPLILDTANPVWDEITGLGLSVIKVMTVIGSALLIKTATKGYFRDALGIGFALVGLLISVSIIGNTFLGAITAAVICGIGVVIGLTGPDVPGITGKFDEILDIVCLAFTSYHAAEIATGG